MGGLQTSAEETSVSATELSELSLKLQAQLENMRKIDGLIQDTANEGATLIEVENVS